MGRCSVQLYLRTSASIELTDRDWIDVSNYVLNISNFDILYNNYDFTLKSVTVNISISDKAVVGYYQPILKDTPIRIKNDNNVIFIGYIDKFSYDSKIGYKYNLTIKSMIEKLKYANVKIGEDSVSGMTLEDLFLMSGTTIFESGVALDEFMIGQAQSVMYEDTKYQTFFNSDIVPKQPPPGGDPIAPFGLYLPRRIIQSSMWDKVVSGSNIGAGSFCEKLTVYKLLESCCMMKIADLSNNLSVLYYDGNAYYMQNIDSSKSISYSDDYIYNYTEDNYSLKRNIDFACDIYYDENIGFPTFDKYYSGNVPLVGAANYAATNVQYTDDSVDLDINNSLVVSAFGSLISYIQDKDILYSIINPYEIQLQRFSTRYNTIKYVVPLTLTEIKAVINAKNVSSVKAIFNKGYLFLEIEIFTEEVL